MSYIPVKTPALIQRLTALLGLQTLNSPPMMALWPGILPVVELSESLVTRKVQTFTLDLTGAVYGVFVRADTVPKGKRRRIWGLSCEGLSSTSLITISNGAPATYKDALIIGPVSVVATTIGFAKDYTYPLVMEADWQIGMWSNGVATPDTAIKFTIHWTEEDAYGVTP